ncbi:MAG: 30S ribosomal protein S20 [Calditrichaeota bacterium]|nr:30S ribosomal protein S20 [Calditrichota bacterium]RQV98908.1 MAG: 30S ribosomal protein S20 [Calditrichota bacterium]
MAHHKSAIKRIKINIRNEERNRFQKSTMKTYTKRVLNSENKEEGLLNYRKASSVLDKMVKNKIIHKNTAANKKSRLMKHVNGLT